MQARSVVAPRSVVATVDDLRRERPFDLVILGAGAAGLAAAVYAGLHGLRALVVESSPWIGGTSALTAGTLWLPGRHPTDDRTAEADAELAATYLEAVVGDDDPSASLRARFLAEGGDLVRSLEERTRVSFVRREHHPDYLGDRPGASVAGRAVEAADFDGRLLGPDLRRLRNPLRDFTIFGGLAPSREEAARYSVIAARPLSPPAVRNAVGAIPRVGRHLLDRARGRRSSHLTLGNALIGRLLATLQDLGTARILLCTSASEIISGPRGVDAVTLLEARTGATTRVGAPAGVISATGGFSRGPRRTALLPDLPAAWSAVPDSVGGEAHRLLERVGAVFARQGSDAFWAPVSLVPARDGGTRVYPHFALDRGKPGFLLVDATGRRFVSEAAPYHLIGEAMRERPERTPGYLIAGRDTLQRYGIGVVRPGGWGLRRRTRDGYVVTGATLAELARRLDIPADALAATVARFDADAARGVDEQLGRGSDAYQRNLGDPRRAPNPSLGPVGTGPYFAIRLYPGDIGSASGFVVDDHARALDADGDVIPGLYVLGSDMRSIMGGRYPGPGITLGPAIVFAGLAVRDAVQRIPATRSSGTPSRAPR